MEGLAQTISEASERFGSLESKRDYACIRSRSIIRMTKNMIHAIHVGEDCSQIRAELSEEVSSMIEGLKDETIILNSAVAEDALMEYAEACIFYAARNGKRIPSFTELGISPQSWTLGLADSIGELRRSILTSLSDGDLDDARTLFSRMEEMNDALMGFDIPDAIVPIRRKQDVARGIVEKTRSDLTNAVIMSKSALIVRD